MRRPIFGIAIFAGFVVAGANAQVLVTPQGWATSPGPAIGVYAPVLVTPEAHLDTPQQAIGATAAAPGQQLGATSSPTTRVLTPTPPSIVPRVVNAPPMVFAVIPQPVTGMQESPASTEVQPNASQQQQGSRINLGMAPIEGAAHGIGNRSLAQAAAAERSTTQQPVSRTLTNQGVQRLIEQTKSGPMGLPAQSSTPAR
jgi:hypothetical protein